MVLMTRENGRTVPGTEEMRNERPDGETDLPPENCTYRDEGCEHADACLDCPFPRCLYDVPHDARRWVVRSRAGGMARLRREGWKIRELAVLYGVSERTVQRTLNHPKRKELSNDAD